MNFNSILVRIQLWYGLVLVSVLLGLGIAAYELERSRVFQQAEMKLRERTRALANALNGPPPDVEVPGEWRPPSAESFHLPPHEREQFETDFFFRITGRSGEEIARSKNYTTETNYIRQAKISTPTGELIIVGHPMTAELAELRRHLLKLAAVGGGILLFGLTVGWLLVARALQPIAEISAAAEKISAGDLAQRINTAGTKSELGRLTAVLNSTFTRLDAAFTLQKRFAADAAHELRTPVSVLIAQTHAAMLKPRSYEENLATIAACHRAAQRMRQLITSLLHLTRLDAGQETARRLKFDLLPVASEAIALVKPLAETAGVKLILDAAPAEISGDPEQWHQVITNLLTNAIQYNRPGGEVRVKFFLENQNVVLQVADTGLGIAAEDLPHIFERFYRADAARSSGNAGLGLSICQAIVAAHGGTLGADSRAGEGSTFTVRLPV